jgi:diguanylate cyclase (GGDEF)-like protein
LINTPTSPETGPAFEPDARQKDYFKDRSLGDLQDEIILLRAVIDNYPGGLMLVDKNLKLVFCNEQQKKLLEYPPYLFEFGNPSLEQLFRFNALRGEYGEGDIEKHVADRMTLVQQRRAHVFERTRPNGTVLEIRGVPLSGGGFMTTYLDITERRPLTKADLDHFKKINELHGQSVGDTALATVARRLQEVVRGNDTVARTGGDRFVILQSDVKRPSDVVRLASRIAHAIGQPIVIGTNSITLSSSAGFALVPRDGTEPESLLEKAEAAVTQAKSKTRGGFEATDAEWN